MSAVCRFSIATFWQFRRFWQSLAALCLRSSARPHPGIDVLLQTKGEVTFDRAVTERSKLFFGLFCC
jgi:hypothetical protein